MKLAASNNPRRERDVTLTAYQIYRFMKSYMTDAEIRGYKQISRPYKSDSNDRIYADFTDNNGDKHCFMVGELNNN